MHSCTYHLNCAEKMSKVYSAMNDKHYLWCYTDNSFEHSAVCIQRLGSVIFSGSIITEDDLSDVLFCTSCNMLSHMLD